MPAELSVGGFNDSLIAVHTWPTLTIARQPIINMAKRATEASTRDPQLVHKHVEAFVNKILAWRSYGVPIADSAHI